MRQSINVVLFGLLSVTFFNAQANEHHHSDAPAGTQAESQEQVIHTTGVVKAINLDDKKVTIAHDAIPAIGWPAMTMRFTFTSPDIGINELKAGDNVALSFVQQGNISLLKEIKVNRS